MLRFVEGNLLEFDAEALVNTVNTVGVMGKGVALMFKEAFPDNFRAYEAACKRKEVRLGEVFVTERTDLLGPRWIVNFPTKAHWRYPSRLEWVQAGLGSLREFIVRNHVKSVAIPPLGSGNGGLQWSDVRSAIEVALEGLSDVDVVVYEPTAKYQNVAKRTGVEKLTPARASVAELVRRYAILGIECTLLEVQKLAYFLERFTAVLGTAEQLDFRFRANKYGPYSDKLSHLLDALDGSYLHCDKRLADAGPYDVIQFDDKKRDLVTAYLTSPEAAPYRTAIDATSALIDGLELPFGMELLATVDWLVDHEGLQPTVQVVQSALGRWPGDGTAAARKLRLFDARVIAIALDTLTPSGLYRR